MTMREIQPVGGYIPLDAEGCLINQTSMSHVVAPWAAVVDDITGAFVSELGDRLIGVYLRGSVPAGWAVPGLSDIDAFALIEPAGDELIRWQEVPWAGRFNQRMSARYDFVTSVDLAVATFDAHFGERNPRLQMVLKTQSLCVHGRDVIPAIDKKYRPGPEMMLNIRWLRSEIDELYAVAAANPDAELMRRKCRELMKVMVRSGFELVMEAEQRYTNCLYWCYRSFASHYPDRAALMERALFLYLNPAGDAAAESVLPLARELGDWMVSEAARVIPAPFLA